MAVRNPFFEAPKFNHKQLIRDVRGADEDIRNMALRNIIQLERKNLANVAVALDEMRKAIVDVQQTWPDEARFFGARAVEHLDELRAQLAKDAAVGQEGIDDSIDLAQLDDPDPKVVVACLKKVEAQVEKAALAKIKDLLTKSDDPQVLGALLSALAVVGEQDALFTIKKLCAHPNARVRAQCIDSVERLAKEPLVAEQMIEPFLGDRDGLVRARAIKALGGGSFARVAKAIELSAASTEVSDRVSLAEALASVKADEGVGYLRRLSEDAEEAVRFKLLEALNRSDHPQKLFIAQKLKKDASPQIRKAAKEAVGQYETKRLLSMGGFDMQAPAGVKNMQSLEDIAAQEDLDPIDLEHLKHRDPEIKLRCLHQIRGRAFAEAHTGVLGLLGVTESEEVIATALRCLTVIGNNKDIDMVMHFVVHQSAEVRAAAAEAIEQLGNKSQVIFLLLPMLHDRELLVRGVAARAMLAHSYEDLRTHAVAMATHKAVGIRVRAVQFFSNYAGPLVQEVLARAARDPAPQVRGALVQVELPQEPWADAIFQALSGDPVEAIKGAAAGAMTGRERRKAAGRESVARPPLEQVLEVAKATHEEASARGKADEEARLAAAARSEGAARAAGGKPGDNVEGTRSLQLLKGNRDMLLEAMGRKVYPLIKRKQINHKAYERTYFVIEKYTHIHASKGGKPKDDQSSSLWGRLKDMAGVSREEEEAGKLQETLRKHYIELGRITMELSHRENILYPELTLEYNELDEVEKKIGGR